MTFGSNILLSETIGKKLRTQQGTKTVARTVASRTGRRYQQRALALAAAGNAKAACYQLARGLDSCDGQVVDLRQQKAAN